MRKNNMTMTHDSKETIITTDYIGDRYPQEVGDVVTVELHGRKYETEVTAHTHMKGLVSGGHIEYRVIEDKWKKVEIKD